MADRSPLPIGLANCLRTAAASGVALAVVLREAVNEGRQHLAGIRNDADGEIVAGTEVGGVHRYVDERIRDLHRPLSHRHGVEEIVKWELSASERAALDEVAEAVSKQCQ